jgi:hypothetical protein
MGRQHGALASLAAFFSSEATSLKGVKNDLGALTRYIEKLGAQTIISTISR